MHWNFFAEEMLKGSEMNRTKPRTSRQTCVRPLLAALILTLGFGACSTTEVAPVPPPKISPPEYVQVPHPAGFDVNDLAVIFQDPKALKMEAVQACDADFLKLSKLTQSQEELRQGARELIKSDPVLYHWCFYGKLLQLEEFLKTAAYIDEKQKKVLETYSFIVPIARGFMNEFQDSRYLRWAIRDYRHLSEWVFFRKLDQTPAMSAELTEVTNPFGLWREPAAEGGSILEKYHLTKTPAARQPEPAPSPVFPPSGESFPAKVEE